MKFWTKTKKVLNVGGGSKLIALPPEYEGYQVTLLDIDPRFKPDLCGDARELRKYAIQESFDAVYNSHNLEHFYRHDVHKVLGGFLFVLKSGGFAHIRVPDVGELIQAVAERKMDIDDFLYTSPAGPVHVYDVFYGFQVEVERSGQDFYAHKTGFTERSLTAALETAGFSKIYTKTGNLEIGALAFNGLPDKDVVERFGFAT